MSENFKLNEALVNDVNYFHISDFQKQDEYSASEENFIIKFYVEKMIISDYYEEEIELYFDGKIFLSYNKNNFLTMFYISIYDEYRFFDTEDSSREGIINIYDGYTSLDDVNITELEALAKISEVKEELTEFLNKNAQNLVIFNE